MIGTGKVKGDIIYFDLSEVSTTGYAKKLTRSASAVTSFGSGATFVLDAGASQYGFRLGVEKGNNYKTFYGYMIGTGKVKGDIIYFDLSEVSTLMTSFTL
jgi:hypothetical protein